MSPRSQLIIALVSSAILFLSIALMFALVIISFFTDGIDFGGQSHMVDGLASTGWALVA
ncbi:hypothetical protein [Microbacterium imperiale]|uniref:Uncharacterized protein n=1 Tax=Microbacterium imperiale TaxID=33884 RepID=A0A9W6M2P6_9MICO|nr:hypothetical protein [Microbacterium imperiale]MBP2419635.1 hypothetical protein [Microbacterium imperiale]MDS0198499.1 hypothetical protein [Microbacterium imperiale]BFE39976.1 hypothetical protein GCM10017544_09320 [Microbacterium imperiale]GLJ79049.1 hypothetical protein GCM10017586_07310 [Microbacterium imperiale]